MMLDVIQIVLLYLILLEVSGSGKYLRIRLNEKRRYTIIAIVCFAGIYLYGIFK